MSEKGKYDSWWNDTLRALSPGHAQQADERAEMHAADMRKKELMNNALEWEQDRNKGMKSLATAHARLFQDDIPGMVDELRNVYNVFPDGGKIGKAEKTDSGYMVNVTGPDQVERKVPFTRKMAQEYLDMAKAELDSENYMKTRYMLNAQQDIFNDQQKQNPQKTADGRYAYQQVDRKGNYKWYTTDEDGKAKELKSRPKLLSEAQATQDRERTIRKDEAAIGKINAEARKYEADIEGIKNPATKPPKISDLKTLEEMIYNLGDNPDKASVAVAGRMASELGYELVPYTETTVRPFWFDAQKTGWDLVPIKRKPGDGSKPKDGEQSSVLPRQDGETIEAYLARVNRSK